MLCHTESQFSFPLFLEEMVHVNPFKELSPLRIHKWSHCLETKRKKERKTWNSFISKRKTLTKSHVSWIQSWSLTMSIWYGLILIKHGQRLIRWVWGGKSRVRFHDQILPYLPHSSCNHDLQANNSDLVNIWVPAMSWALYVTLLKREEYHVNPGISQLSCVRLFETLWVIACQVPLSIEFSRQEYWVAIPFSRESSQLWVSCIVGRFFTVWAMTEWLTLVLSIYK